MRELEVLGLHSDGQHIVLSDTEGARYILPVDEKLRTLVRTDRKLVGALTQTSDQLGPKEIQKLIRAGATSSEIAAAYDADEKTISRFESAILAERRYIARRATSSFLNSNPNAPTLGDLVIDRLATRGVSPESITWDATRTDDDPWIVQVSFAQAAQELHATWSFEVKTSHLVALDEEAHWLTETTIGSSNDAASTVTPLPLIPDASSYGDVEAKTHSARAKTSTKTLNLLDSLAARRGKRIEVDYDDIEDLETQTQETDSQEDSKETSQKPTGSQGDTPDNVSALPVNKSDEDSLIPTLPGMPKADQTKEPKKNKKARRSVPGWDEIIFGTKPE